MDSVRDKIRDALRDKGLTLVSVSKRLGKNPSYLQQFLERGSPKKLPEDVRHSLATLLGIEESDLRHTDQKRLPTASKPSKLSSQVETHILPVIGRVQAGVWEVVDLVDQSELADHGLMLPVDPRFPFDQQWIMQIQGDSVNEFANSGSYAHCIDIASGIDVRHGQLVVVERIRAQGSEIERTIKQYKNVGGKVELWPRSTNDRHNGPIQLHPGNGEDIEIRIKGVVINFVNPAPGFD